MKKSEKSSPPPDLAVSRIGRERRRQRPWAAVAVTAALALTGAASCGQSSDHANPGSGGGGAPGTGGNPAGGAGAGGAAGRGVYTAPACDPGAGTLGGVTTASPRISIGKRVAASAGVTNAARAVDGLYSHNGAFLPSPSEAAPAWVAIELGAGPDRVLVSWADISYTDYNAPGTGPGAYTLSTSGDSTDGQDGTWDIVVTVTGNGVRERAHVLPFTGQSWLKMQVTAAASPSPLLPGVSLDEVEVHDISASGATPPVDSWFFMGDSITVNAFRRQYGAQYSFDGIIHAARPAYAPTMIDGGIGGELSGMGVAHIASWLALNPDVVHLGIMYGTNDSWNDQPVGVMFEANMRAIVKAALDDHRVPILARLPYSTVAPHTLPDFNAVVDAIATDNHLPCGPDLYAWFRDHPEEISGDGVHPNDVGYTSINRLWAEAMMRLYPAN